MNKWFVFLINIFFVIKLTKIPGKRIYKLNFEVMRNKINKKHIIFTIVKLIEVTFKEFFVLSSINDFRCLNIFLKKIIENISE